MSTDKDNSTYLKLRETKFEELVHLAEKSDDLVDIAGELAMMAKPWGLHYRILERSFRPNEDYDEATDLYREKFKSEEVDYDLPEDLQEVMALLEDVVPYETDPYDIFFAARAAELFTLNQHLLPRVAQESDAREDWVEKIKEIWLHPSTAEASYYEVKMDGHAFGAIGKLESAVRKVYRELGEGEEVTLRLITYAGRYHIEKRLNLTITEDLGDLGYKFSARNADGDHWEHFLLCGENGKRACEIAISSRSRSMMNCKVRELDRTAYLADMGDIVIG